MCVFRSTLCYNIVDIVQLPHRTTGCSEDRVYQPATFGLTLETNTEAIHQLGARDRLQNGVMLPSRAIRNVLFPTIRSRDYELVVFKCFIVRKNKM